MLKDGGKIWLESEIFIFSENSSLYSGFLEGDFFGKKER